MLAAAIVVLVANLFGLWWLGYAAGALAALLIAPWQAAVAVAAGWGLGFVADAVTENLPGSARVVAAIAGLSPSLGPALIAIAIILAYLQGYLPARIVRSLRSPGGKR